MNVSISYKGNNIATFFSCAKSTTNIFLALIMEMPKCFASLISQIGQQSSRESLDNSEPEI